MYCISKTVEKIPVIPATFWSDWSKKIIKFLFYILTWSLIIQAGRAELYFIAIDVLQSKFVPELIEKSASPGSRPVLVMNNVCRLFLAKSTKNNEYNHYVQSNLSTDNVPLSAHKWLFNKTHYGIEYNWVVYLDPQISLILSE